MESKVQERAESLRHAVAYGLENGKKNLIVDLDLLDEIFRGNVPVGGNEFPPEKVNELLYEVKAERDRLQLSSDRTRTELGKFQVVANAMSEITRLENVVKRQEQALKEVDWEGVGINDLIQSNRDAILKMHEEASRRINKVLIGGGNQHDAEKLAYIGKVLHALSVFHPMHGESWIGWPEAMALVEDDPSDPNLSCDQCSKPQWDDGSGLCSWRAGTEFGSCDGRQIKEKIDKH